MEQELWWSDRRSQISAEGHSTNGSITDLHPLVAKNDPWLSFVVDEQLLSQSRGVTGPSLIGRKGPLGLSAEGLGSTVDTIRFETHEHIVTTIVRMHFRRQELTIRPKVSVRTESRVGAFPILEIRTGVIIRARFRRRPALRSHSAKKLIEPFIVDWQHEPITTMDLDVLKHRLLQYRGQLNDLSLGIKSVDGNCSLAYGLICCCDLAVEKFYVTDKIRTEFGSDFVLELREEDYKPSLTSISSSASKPCASR